MNDTGDIRHKHNTSNLRHKQYGRCLHSIVLRLYTLQPSRMFHLPAIMADFRNFLYSSFFLFLSLLSYFSRLFIFFSPFFHLVFHLYLIPFILLFSSFRLFVFSFSCFVLTASSFVVLVARRLFPRSVVVTCYPGYESHIHERGWYNRNQ